MSEDGIRVEIENIKYDIKELKEVTKQHTGEIANLKESDIELKVYVKQIFEKIDEMKVMIQNKKDEKEEQPKSDERLDKFIDVMLQTFQNANTVKEEINKEESKTKNTMKINNNKQLWITIGAICTAICTILVAVFK